MSRPDTLSEIAERVSRGAAFGMAAGEFLDQFYLADNAGRVGMLQSAPALLPDPKLNALLGAMAEYLSRQHGLPSIPAWVSAPERSLSEPWFTHPEGCEGMAEYLFHTSPAEFRSRNIFTEGRPLRRATSPR